MSIDFPQKNKMIDTAPAKKEFHFAATATHYAQIVYAETTEEATKIYHKIKVLINPPAEKPASEKTENTVTTASAEEATGEVK
jgi:hypothetical protein